MEQEYTTRLDQTKELFSVPQVEPYYSATTPRLQRQEEHRTPEGSAASQEMCPLTKDLAYTPKPGRKDKRWPDTQTYSCRATLFPKKFPFTPFAKMTWT